MAECRPVNVPMYDELTVKNNYDQVLQDNEVAQLFPNLDCSQILPNRDYFYTVLNTLRPDYVSKLIEEAKKKDFFLK
jgi:hypothetical protein